MRWTLEPDLGAFDASVRPLLEAHIENNVVATVVTATGQVHYRASPPVLAVGLDGGGRVTAAALRTAPRPMLCTPVDPDGADALPDLWLEHVPDLPGVNPLLDPPRGIADACKRRKGASEYCRTAVAM